MKDLKKYISQLRYDFSLQTLSESDVHADPLLQFEKWFREAVRSDSLTPNAMVLCTASKEGQPSGRILLLRNFNESGFVFYTNYQSQKASHLLENPFASMVFFWPELERQVRIEGNIIKQGASESDEYFSLRPDTSKWGAWSSPQSKIIKNRETLDEQYALMKEKFQHVIPRPDFWGGYILQPSYYEFWQGRPSRLHDRIAYRLQENKWMIHRLAP